MKSKGLKNKYVAFLRGINVGGHHKVPMAELQKEMSELNFDNIVTYLNSGNIIFETIDKDSVKLEKIISEHLEKVFGFPIPTIIRKSEMILELWSSNPFKNEILTKESRFYISFLRKETETELALPWANEDHSFKIMRKTDKNILSVLDLSKCNTPKGMKVLERYFGADITTRNWNTILKIKDKLEVSH